MASPSETDVLEAFPEVDATEEEVRHGELAYTLEIIRGEDYSAAAA
jgi:hypothetical protein